MFDWPNLIAGFILGVLGTLAFWLPDRARAKRAVVQEARASWAVAAKQIELAVWRPTMTQADLYRLRVQYPIDHWRTVLGPHDFEILGSMESAYANAEHKATEASNGELTKARTAFINMSRQMQSEGYSQAVDAEHQKRVRRDYLRHPIRTWKRERHNRRVHRDAGMV